MPWAGSDSDGTVTTVDGIGIVANDSGTTTEGKGTTADCTGTTNSGMGTTADGTGITTDGGGTNNGGTPAGVPTGESHVNTVLKLEVLIFQSLLSRTMTRIIIKY